MSFWEVLKWELQPWGLQVACVLPDARNSEPDLLWREVTSGETKKFVMVFFFLSVNWQIPYKSILLPTLWLTSNTLFLSWAKSWMLCCFLFFSLYLLIPSSVPLRRTLYWSWIGKTGVWVAICITLIHVQTKYSYWSFDPYFMLLSPSEYNKYSYILKLGNNPLGNHANTFHKA